MGRQWHSVPITNRMFLNLHETALTTTTAAIENAFQNEAEGISRFPGMNLFKNLDDNGRIYLAEWRGDMIAASSNGNVYRLDKEANDENVTGVPVMGGKRVVFTKSPDELVMAAGGQMIRFAGAETEVLSEDAPEATHVGFIDNYLVAGEKGTGLFYHSDAGAFRTWPVLNAFAVDSLPDNVNSLIVTPFRELMICGPRSIEQFERIASGDSPFFRRWGVGEGVMAPYTLCFADNAVWAINDKFEFIRFSGQVSQPNSGDIGRSLEAIATENFDDAWAEPVYILGQKFILLQIPKATNVYDTQGITLLFDYRQQKWSTLYGWDSNKHCPTRWPGWSYLEIWGRRFVGCDGKICELSNDVFSNDGDVQRFYGRTAHYSELGEVRIDNLRMRLRRGTGSNTDSGTISVRGVRDNKRKTKWIRKKLGKAGDKEFYVEFGGMGCGHSHQFEWFVTDDAPVEIVKVDVQVTTLGE